MARTIFTTADRPLRIAEIPVGHRGGVIGVTFAPGKQQSGAMSGDHRRDLQADLDLVARWGAAVVVTLVEAHELDALGIPQLGPQVQARGMAWQHAPIRDYGVPDAVFEAAWPRLSSDLRARLAGGQRVLVHCKGGLGRAGSVAARLLVETGIAPTTAIAAVRAVRPGAIETGGQEAWVAAGTAVGR